MDWRLVLERLVAGHDLEVSEAESAMQALMHGAASEVEVAAFLTALQAKGVTGTELATFALVMQDHAIRLDHELPDVLDTCGTGGGLPSFNISTAAAIVAAAAGARVAKHGNRAMTSRCGSADVLEALGITITAPLDVWRGTLEQFRIAFLFAPNHHPAMRFVGPVRKALGIRTVFNQLGPLANPARAKRQVIGVYDDALLRPMAEAAHLLGIEKAWVARGQDGLDEVSPCGKTNVAEVSPDGVKMRVISPSKFGLASISPDALTPGETPEENSKILTEAISDADSPRAAALLPSAAAALYVAGIADSLPDAAERAREAVRSGAAWELVEVLREVTSG